MSASDIRRQLIQQVILRDLKIRFEAAPGVLLQWRDICYGLSNAIVSHTEEEIRAALADLVERGLVESHELPMGLSVFSEQGFKITADGRDFEGAGCPFREINRFGRKT